jgi:hypothetical protein
VDLVFFNEGVHVVDSVACPLGGDPADMQWREAHYRRAMSAMVVK